MAENKLGSCSHSSVMTVHSFINLISFYYTISKKTTVKWKRIISVNYKQAMVSISSRVIVKQLFLFHYYICENKNMYHWKTSFEKTVFLQGRVR